MIKDALRSLPARPALFIAPLIAVVVLVYYYWDLHNRCTELKQQRLALTTYLQSLQPASSLQLADAIRFGWDKVRIVVDLGGAQRALECPFGWNWASGERDALIKSGLLTGMIFGLQDSIVSYLELRADEVEFRGVESVLLREKARFSVSRAGDDGSTVVLTLQR